MESLDFLNTQFDGFRIVESIEKEELLNSLPRHYKTSAKLAYINTLGDNITEDEFVGLLLKQTHSDDYINYEYFIKYYDLNLDTNNMIIFNDKFTYSMCKKETLYIWWIVKNMQLHPLFSSYIDSDITYTFQKKLELTSLISSHNRRYDLCFPKQEILVEINEPHHSTAKETRKDRIKFSITKLNGTQLISLVTDNIDKINQFLNDVLERPNSKFNKIYKMLHKAIIEEISNALDGGLNDELECYLDKLIDYRLYNKKQEYPDNIKKIINEYEFDRSFYQTYVDKHIKIIIDNHVANEINDSDDLRDFLDMLYHRMLCSMLSDYNFMQDYIKQVFTKEMFIYLEKITKYVYTIETIEEIKLNKVDFTDRYNLLTKFMEESSEFDKLFNMKKQSLSNSNNTISINDVLELLNMSTLQEAINEICYICKITPNEYISWKDVQTIILAQSDSNEFKQMLLLYYVEIDSIYLTISRYVSEHHTRISGARDDFENNEKHRESKTNDLLNCQLSSIIKYLKDIDVSEEILDDLSTKYKKDKKLSKKIVNTEANINDIYKTDKIDICVSMTDLEKSLENFNLAISSKKLELSPK